MAYLDHAASSPIRPEVAQAYAQALGVCGNPSASHSHGRAARAVVEDARDVIAQFVNADRAEVVFTSGGTESDNLAVLGAWRARRPGTGRIVASAIDHHAVLDAVEHLVDTEGAQVSWVAPDSGGVITAQAVAEALDEPGAPVALISVMTAGNETGIVNDIPGIAQLAQQREIPLHTDAVAAAGHIPLTVDGIDFMTITAHKLGGPVGIGALIARRGAQLGPTSFGGGQERSLRSGTINAAGAHAFATAAALAGGTLEAETARLTQLRDELIGQALGHDLGIDVVGVWEAGNATDRLSHIAHLWVPNADSDALSALLDLAGVSVSAGSACAAGVTQLSHVLTAMGYPDGSGAAIRASVGWNSTSADVAAFAAALPDAVTRARQAAGAAVGPRS